MENKQSKGGEGDGQSEYDDHDHDHQHQEHDVENPPANSDTLTNGKSRMTLTPQEEFEQHVKALLAGAGGAGNNKPQLKRPTAVDVTIVNYNGQTIYSAASQGNLPVCVLLWGIAAAKRINLMAPDTDGNTPMHYGCLANNCEVLGFFMQQLQGKYDENTRLLDVRNNNGETPLLRAMITGELTVVKGLLDEGSDPLVQDYNDNNVLSICAKNCRFWCLNYMFEYIKGKQGENIALDLLKQPNKDGFTALEWSAESGDLNCLEFCIRKGLNPFRINEITGETALHVAVRRHRIDTVKVLMDIGCDLSIVNKQGATIFQIHSVAQDGELRSIIMNHPRVRGNIRTCFKPIENRKSESKLTEPVVCSYQNSEGRHMSYCVFRASPTRPLFVLSYSALVFIIWLLAIGMPFWAWFPFVGIAAGVYHYMASQVGNLQKRAKAAQGRMLLLPHQQFLGAPEKFLGFWFGSMLAYLLYIFCMFAYEEGDNPFQLGAIDGYAHEPAAVMLLFVSLIVTIVLWTCLVWVYTDPGIVNTRHYDFNEILKESNQVGGLPPNHNLYCKTSLVKKPVRSKYCSTSGYVVSRFDHYCAWLNGAVGYNNHRMFMMFLYFHLAADILCMYIMFRSLRRATARSASVVAGELLSQQNLFVTALCAFLILVTAFNVFLTVEQTLHIFKNRTTNEKVNGSRYAWMKDDAGQPFNRFDRGPLANFLEFWRFPGYVVDYQTLLTIPPVNKARSQSTKEHGNTIAMSNVLMSTQNTIHENCDHSNHSHNHSHSHHDDI